MVRHVVRVLFLFWLAAHGCIPEVVDSDEDGGRSGEVGSDPRGLLGDQEPNNDFSTAIVADLSERPEWFEITGIVDSDEDYDVYSLGGLDAGRRVVTTLESSTYGDVTVCLFDDHERLLARGTAIDPAYPRTFEFVSREPVENLFLVAFVPHQGLQQAYSVSLEMRQDEVVLSYEPQIVVLNFEGAQDVFVAGRMYPSIPPFDAVSIDSRFAGRSSAMVESVLERVRRDYAGLGVQIYLSSDPDIPPGDRSIVHFGASNPDLLGVADGVDPFNAYAAQTAIIYTDTFSLFSSLDPDEDMMAQLLANVTSHEIGHLLGLRHTQDDEDLMDVTATARRLMFDQWFKRAQLHASVCPLGYQDAPAMLSWTVGGKLSAPPPKAQRRMVTGAGGPDDFEVPRHLLSSHCSAGDS